MSTHTNHEKLVIGLISGQVMQPFLHNGGICSSDFFLFFFEKQLLQFWSTHDISVQAVQEDISVNQQREWSHPADSKDSLFQNTHFHRATRLGLQCVCLKHVNSDDSKIQMFTGQHVWTYSVCLAQHVNSNDSKTQMFTGLLVWTYSVCVGQPVNIDNTNFLVCTALFDCSVFSPHCAYILSSFSR